MGICVSTGAACDTKKTQVSHVLKAIGLEDRYARGTIRISLGKDNTIEDCDRYYAGIYGITNRKNLPTHVSVKAPTGGLFADSVIMLEQIRTLDKSRLRQFIGRVDDETMHRIETAAKTSLGIRS